MDVQKRLDVAGLLRYKIGCLGAKNHPVEWISGEDYQNDLPTISSVRHFSLPIQNRILRLTSHLHSEIPGGGHWLTRGLVASASLGSPRLALNLIDSWLSRRWSPIEEARARLVTRRLWKEMRAALSPPRELVDGVLDFGDMPALLTPSLVRHRNRFRTTKNWLVLSGGDNLSVGFWLWQFSADGIGVVLERNIPQNRLDELWSEIGIHLNHPRFEDIDGHLYSARQQVRSTRC